MLSTIDASLKAPRTAESDGVAKTLRVEGADDPTRDKCAVLLYSALSIDSRAGEWMLWCIRVRLMGQNRAYLKRGPWLLKRRYIQVSRARLGMTTEPVSAGDQLRNPT